MQSLEAFGLSIMSQVFVILSQAMVYVAFQYFPFDSAQRPTRIARSHPRPQKGSRRHRPVVLSYSHKVARAQTNLSDLRNINIMKV